MQITFPKKTEGLFKPGYRFYVLYGGRASGKSWAAARALIILSLQSKIRILCIREFMSSISSSVHKLLCDQIESLKLNAYFDTTNNKITSINGSEFIFAGIKNDPSKIKSTEGIDYCFIEEAETISEASWQILIPTIRKPDSKFFICFNPKAEADPTYQRFIVNPPPRTWSREINYLDNPFCPTVMHEEANHQREIDYDMYEHIWLGKPLKMSDAVIFKNKFEVKEFEPDPKAQFKIGIDFGYTDSLAATKSYIDGEYLYICEEVYETKVEMDEMPQKLIDGIPLLGKGWPCRADSADPKSILFLKRRNFLIKAVKKGPNSILDGINYLKSFRKIFIHPSCVNTINEFENYSWEQDRLTNEILPRPKDKFNHAIDSIRYAFEETALNKGTSVETWAKLAKR